MKNDKLDKAFKEGLKKGQMPYSESYWAEMESLIPPPAQTAKPAVALSYRLASWFLSIVMVGIAGYFWLSEAEVNSGLPEPTNQEQKAVDQVAIPANEQATDAKATGKVNGKEAQADAETDAIPVTSKTNKPISTEGETPVATLNTNAAKVSTTNAGSGNAEASKTAHPAQAEMAQTELNENLPAATENAAKADVAKTEGKNTDEAIAAAEAKAAGSVDHAEKQKEPANTGVDETNKLAENTVSAQKTSAPEEAAQPIILPHQKGKKFLWSAGADYQYLLLNRSLTTTNPELTDYVAFRNQYENASYQSGVGVNVQLEMDKWLFNSGVYSVTFHEDISYPGSLMVNVGVDNGQWQTQDIWNYTVDSTWIIDSIYVGHWQPDTTWSLTVDSLWQPQWDTVATEKEAPELTANNGVFSLSYLEIPLWFGRSFGNNQLHFDVQAGLGFGILTGTKGSVYINQKLDGLVSTSYQVEQFSQFNMSGMLRAGIRYEFTEQLQALLYPTVRYTFTSVFSDAAIRQRYFGYGLTVGVVYRF